MAEAWNNTVENWLLECSEASKRCQLQPSPKPVPDIADSLSQEQIEQLLAVCDLHQDKLLQAIFTLLEERNRLVALRLI